MKKIKFRGWDTLSPKMYNGHSLTLQSDGTLMFLDTDGEWKQDENERWVVMQFTGLRDKNGKEIYEGDIVKWGHITTGEEDPLRIAVVNFNPDIQFDTNPTICKHKYIFHYASFAYDTKKYVEVIGNRFENPDLLK